MKLPVTLEVNDLAPCRLSLLVPFFSMVIADFIKIPHSFVPALRPLHMLFLLPETPTPCLSSSVAVKHSLTAGQPGLGSTRCHQERLAQLVWLCKRPTPWARPRLDWTHSCSSNQGYVSRKDLL